MTVILRAYNYVDYDYGYDWETVSLFTNYAYQIPNCFFNVFMSMCLNKEHSARAAAAENCYNVPFGRKQTPVCWFVIYPFSEEG